MLATHKNENYAKHLLINLNLERYIDNFINNGYDDLDIIRQIDDTDLDIMLITDRLDRKDIVETVRLLNQGINKLYGYMEVEPEVLTPSGQELADPVALKLQSEGITLSSKFGLFFKEDGYPCTMRDYDLLRARYAQELQVPRQSICEALTILHCRPTKPPKPKDIPVYDTKSGKLLWNNKILKEKKSNYVNVEELIYDPDHNMSPISCTERSAEHRRYEEIAELDHKIQAGRRQKDIQHGVSIRKKTLFQKIKTSIIHMRKSNHLETTSSTKTLISDRSSGSFCPSCCGEKSPNQVIKSPAVKDSTNKHDWQRSSSVPVINTTVSIPPTLTSSCTSCTSFQLTSTNAKRGARKQSADSGNHSWGSNDSRHSQCQSCGPYDIYAHVRWDDVPLTNTLSSGSFFSPSSSSRTSSIGTTHCNPGYYNSDTSCVQYTGLSQQSSDLNDLEDLQGSLKDLLQQIETLKNNSFN